MYSIPHTCTQPSTFWHQYHTCTITGRPWHHQHVHCTELVHWVDNVNSCITTSSTGRTPHTLPQAVCAGVTIYTGLYQNTTITLRFRNTNKNSIVTPGTCLQTLPHLVPPIFTKLNQVPYASTRTPTLHPATCINTTPSYVHRMFSADPPSYHQQCYIFTKWAMDITNYAWTTIGSSTTQTLHEQTFPHFSVKVPTIITCTMRYKHQPHYLFSVVTLLDYNSHLLPTHDKLSLHIIPQL